jgi:hypothetical protein
MEVGMKKPEPRLFGEEFITAEEKVFAKLPKKYHGDVKDLLNRLQLWDMVVFLNVSNSTALAHERAKAKKKSAKRTR